MHYQYALPICATNMRYCDEYDNETLEPELRELWSFPTAEARNRANREIRVTVPNGEISIR